MMRIEGLTFTYPEEKLALSDVSFEIRAGEKIVLLGANGCGKSTLLKILNGLIFPRSGKYLFRDHRITKRTLKGRSLHRDFRSSVVLLFQRPDAMLFNPTVYDEIAFGPRQLGMDGVEQRVARWSEEFGLTDLLRREPFSLSGGEKQKVCLASLLALEPDVLLLDEPTANLDPRTTGWLVDLLQDLTLTTVVATHNLSLAAELGERTLLLSEDHRLTYDGPLTPLLEDRERLLGANLLHRHRHRHEGLEHRHYHTHDWS
jgi:cobalt/nickel transport system ATP-binding protein